MSVLRDIIDHVADMDIDLKNKYLQLYLKKKKLKKKDIKEFFYHPCDKRTEILTVESNSLSQPDSNSTTPSESESDSQSQNKMQSNFDGENISECEDENLSKKEKVSDTGRLFKVV